MQLAGAIGGSIAASGGVRGAIDQFDNAGGLAFYECVIRGTLQCLLNAKCFVVDRLNRFECIGKRSLVFLQAGRGDQDILDVG